MTTPPKVTHGFVTLDRLFSQPNLPAQEYHVQFTAPATPEEAHVDLHFHVLVAYDLCVATDDPIVTELLDTFMEEERSVILMAYYLTEENPDVMTVSTWVAAGDRIEGWSRETQAEVAEHSGANPFAEGDFLNGSAWPAKYGGCVV